MLLLDGHSGVSEYIISSDLHIDVQVTRPRHATAMSIGVSNQQLANRFQPRFSPTLKLRSSIFPKSCRLTHPADPLTRHT